MRILCAISYRVGGWRILEFVLSVCVVASTSANTCSKAWQVFNALSDGYNAQLCKTAANASGSVNKSV